VPGESQEVLRQVDVRQARFRDLLQDELRRSQQLFGEIGLYPLRGAGGRQRLLWYQFELLRHLRTANPLMRRAAQRMRRFYRGNRRQNGLFSWVQPSGLDGSTR
jgi:hypothetical protein